MICDEFDIVTKLQKNIYPFAHNVKFNFVNPIFNDNSRLTKNIRLTYE